MERATGVPESFAQSADRDQVNDYDSVAEAYAAENENNLVNAYALDGAKPITLPWVYDRKAPGRR